MASIYSQKRGSSGPRNKFATSAQRRGSSIPFSVQRGNSGIAMSVQRGNSGLPLSVQRGNSGMTDFPGVRAARKRAATETMYVYCNYSSNTFFVFLGHPAQLRKIFDHSSCIFALISIPCTQRISTTPPIG